METKFDRNELLKKLVIQDGRVYLDEGDFLNFLDEISQIPFEGKHAKLELTPEIQYKVEEHSKLCDSLKNLYATKNADYGDSMHPLFEEYGLTAFLILFGTKINRIKTLMNKNSTYYENLEDSLIDLANYALIAVTELRAKNKCEDENSPKA